MRADEIIIRQDRVVYTLMILLAGLGLLWSFWQHQHNTEIPGAAAHASAATVKTPSGASIYVQ